MEQQEVVFKDNVEYEFTGTGFSPNNFTKSVHGNEAFPGIGARTIYVPTTSAGKWFPGGFPIRKATALVDQDGKKIRDLAAGEKVWFTYPAKLFKGSSLGKMPAPFTYAAINTQPGGSSEGFVSISAVTKPSPKVSGGRANKGATSQQVVADYAVAKMKEAGHEVDEANIIIASKGSTIPDIRIPVDGKTIQFEVKGADKDGDWITVFDKTARRTSSSPEVLDDIAGVYIDALGLKINDRTFLGLLDYYRAKDNSVGLAGDPGVKAKSGSFPREFATQDPRVLIFARDLIIDHFKAEGEGDDYFAVHTRSGNQVSVWHTGKTTFNPMNADELPTFKAFMLGTYGGASSGGTRVGLKIKL